MGSEIASLFVTIGANTQGLVKGTTDAKTALSKVAQSFQSATGLSLGFTSATGAAVMAVKALWEELKKEEAAANESNIADAKLLAVYEATGAAVNLTKKELEDLATQVSKNAGVDDELVKSAEAVLMTFKGINDNVFKQTIVLAQDMASVLGGDLQDKVQLLGKSLTDFDEYTKLQRTLGGFTEEQEESIAKFKETNDLVGYQSYLLSILQERYGGAAKKINEASDGQNDLTIAIENYREELGKDLPYIKRAWNEYWAAYYHEQTKAIQTSRELREETKSLEDSMRALGIVVVHNTDDSINYYKDGLKLTKEEAIALIQAQEDLIDSNNGLTATIGDNLNSFGGLDAMLEDVSDTMKGGAEDVKDYAAAYQETSSYIEQFMDLQGKSADEVEAATKRIILSMLEQQLAADGLTEAEMNYLLTLGVQLGVYSKEAVEAYNKAEAAAKAYAKAIADMPSQKTITIITNYVANHPSGYVPATGSTMHAAGGSYQLSPFAGFEGVSMGGGQSASGNEVVSVSNQNQLNDMTAQIAEAIDTLNNLGPTIQRAVRDGMIQGAA